MTVDPCGMDYERRFRQLVLARSWGRCECCGTAWSSDAHHRQPRGAGGVHGVEYVNANQVSNGLAVCRSCHDRIDADAPTARTNGWLVAHPTPPATVPALIYTPQGYGWWLLDNEACYTPVYDQH